MTFDRNTSKIALTVPYFTLHGSSDGARRRNRWYNEPYLLSFAVDSAGKAKPGIDFNMMPFPKVQRGDTVEMVGNGHLIYGPKHPGEFVAATVLVMESDQDVRVSGERIREFTRTKAVELGLGAITSANPTAGAVLGVLKEVVQFVAGRLTQNGDDELMRIEGTFLRDDIVPFHINRRYKRRNDFAELALQVIPLEQSNGQGAPISRINLT